MAGKTNADLLELISELRTELEVLRAQLNSLHKEMDLNRPEFVQLRDRVIKVESLLDLAKTAELFRQVPVLQEQVTELKKWREETDRRKGQFWIGVGICAITFVSNVVVGCLLYFARKPG
jgi:hypothetical protein